MSIKQTLGNAVDILGTALGLPEYGRSEQIAGYVPTTNTGYDASTGGTSNLEAWKNVNFVQGSQVPTTSTPAITTPATSSKTGSTSTGSSGGVGQYSIDPNNLDTKYYNVNGTMKSGRTILAETGGTGSYGSSGGSSDISAELEKTYQDSINYLSGLEGNARNDYASSIDTTNQAYGLAKTQSQGTYNQTLNSYNENQTDLEASKRSALSDAIRAYNALSQQGMSRFGGGSSAGEAVGELAKQEYFRQNGQTEQAYVKQARDIKNQVASLQLQQKNYEDSLELEKTSALNDLKKEFDTKLSQIQLQKNATEQAKSQARISIIQDSINQSRQITLAFNERAATIRESVYQKMAELNGNYNKLLELADQYESGQYFDSSNPYSNASIAGTNSGTSAYNYAYKNKSSDEDENPFI